MRRSELAKPRCAATGSDAADLGHLRKGLFEVLDPSFSGSRTVDSLLVLFSVVARLSAWPAETLNPKP